MKYALPKAPGVYIFKDELGRVIYVGKAKNIHKRVQSYFGKKGTDWKVQSLIDEHSKIDYILAQNETEALLLEAQLIQSHKPKFNILLKDGQPFVYILFSRPKGNDLPRLEIVRNKIKSGQYVGPFLCKQQARNVHRYLIETFKLSLCNKKMKNGCLDYHLGLCAGNCKEDFDLEDYLFRLTLSRDVLKKRRDKLVDSIEQQIIKYNQGLNFEKAMHLHEYQKNLDIILHTIETRFTASKYWHEIEKKTMPELAKYELAEKLQKFLKMEKPIKTIDCFDISHFQSNALVGSCIRFVNGRPDKNNFRKFKIRSLTQQNDYAALQEIVARRYKYYLQGNEDAKKDLPDLVLIDGGKGQLSAVEKILPDVSCISLAKKEETVYGLSFSDGIKLDIKDPVGRLLIALRDYAHHFAISYHRFRIKRPLQSSSTTR